MIRFRLLFLACAALIAACHGSRAAADFIVAPYLQLGDLPRASQEEGMSVLWHATDADRPWGARYRATGSGAEWLQAADLTYTRVDVAGIEPHRVYRATLTRLAPGGEFEYEITLAGAKIFGASGRARRPASQPQRFAVTGDTAQASAGQKKIAVQIVKSKPDYVFITGDLVYGRGRISEYRDKFYPIFNHDEADPSYGAPALRSILFIAVPGNHDLSRDFSAFQDPMAYFYYWTQPLNGPAAKVPELTGPADAAGRFRDAAGARYPRMANFSFDYGNAHWVALDSMPYMDWTDAALREWLIADLKAAKDARWKFVGFHHPGFNSSKAHFNEQRMRVLAPLFEEYGVDIVFNGHVHNYQRSYPLKFVPKMQAGGSYYRANGNVEGTWALDKTFDGARNTEPRGVIYIVTGAGGAGLYDPEQEADPKSWQEFTAKFVSTIHSLTLVETSDRKLTLRQVSALGQELDNLVLTK